MDNWTLILLCVAASWYISGAMLSAIIAVLEINQIMKQEKDITSTKGSSAWLSWTGAVFVTIVMFLLSWGGVTVVIYEWKKSLEKHLNWIVKNIKKKDEKTNT